MVKGAAQKGEGGVGDDCAGRGTCGCVKNKVEETSPVIPSLERTWVLTRARGIVKGAAQNRRQRRTRQGMQERASNASHALADAEEGAL